jgi:hypothetical protein
MIFSVRPDWFFGNIGSIAPIAERRAGTPSP